MPFGRFITLATLGSIVWIGGLALLGREVGSQWQTWRHHLEYVDYVGRGVLVVPSSSCRALARGAEPATHAPGRAGGGCRRRLTRLMGSLARRAGDRRRRGPGAGCAARPGRAVADLLLGPYRPDPVAVGLGLRDRPGAAQGLRGGAARRHRGGAADHPARRGLGRGARREPAPEPSSSSCRSCPRRSSATRWSAHRAPSGNAGDDAYGAGGGIDRDAAPSRAQTRTSRRRPGPPTRCGSGSRRRVRCSPGSRATARRWRRHAGDGSPGGRQQALAPRGAPVIAGATLLKSVRLARRGLPPGSTCPSCWAPGRPSPRRWAPRWLSARWSATARSCPTPLSHRAGRRHPQPPRPAPPRSGGRRPRPRWRGRSPIDIRQWRRDRRLRSRRSRHAAGRSRGRRAGVGAQLDRDRP